MQEFEIWMEGYKINGGQGKASYVGKACGHSFEEAVRSWANTCPYAVDLTYLSVWGCQLFPSEQEARKSFG